MTLLEGVLVLLGAAVAGAGGLLVPRLVAALPEPEPEPEPDVPGAEAPRPRPTYAEVAARPGLGPRCGLLAAVVGALVSWALVRGDDAAALVGLVPLVPVAVALAVVDLHTSLLPSRLVLPATGALLALGVLGWAVTGEREDLVRGLVGLVGVRSLYWVMWWIRSAGLGFGDVRLGALVGFALAHLGWAQLLVGVYAGFLVFGVPGLVLALVRRDRSLLKVPYPYGPAMLAGALVGVLAGPAVAGLAGG